MDFEFWREMVKSGETAYAARQRFDPESFEHPAVWCFQRFGSTRTPLPDGRIICIAGEHEDYYDPDFCIYNDVIVVEPDGDFHIYGYPRELFPPTDFHTATLVGDCIIIVGNAGYIEERGHTTPVFSLDLSTLAITRLEPAGESPGWIHKHNAMLAEDLNTLCIYGDREEDEPANRWTGVAALELDTLTWRTIPPARPLEEHPELDERLIARRWETIKPSQRDFELNNLRVDVPLRHPLFACNVTPWATGPNCQVLYRMLDGSGRLAEVTLNDGNQHAVLPLPETMFHDDVEAFIRSLDATAE